MIELLDVVIEPNDCDVTAALSLEMSFRTRRPLREAQWSMSVVFDAIDKRQILELGHTTPADYDGISSVLFKVDAINVDGIEPSVLANCGLLVAALYVGREELCKVNMVVQVTTSVKGLDDILEIIFFHIRRFLILPQVTRENDGRFIRSIYSPLE